MSEILNIHQRFCDYSLVFKGNTPRTIMWLKEATKYYFEFSKVNSFADATRHSIEDWIFWGKTNRNWLAKTIRVRLQALSLFFDWCVKEKYIQKNPVEDISKPKLPKRIPRHLSRDEALNLLEWTKNFPYTYKFDRTRATAIIAMFIYTGIRLQELKNLKVSDIDMESKTLFVRCGKGEKDRIIPLNQRLIEIIEKYLKDRRRLKKTCPYFFTAMRADRRMGDKVITRMVQKLRKKSGIQFYPHLLRHTFAVLMLQGLKSDKQLSQKDVRRFCKRLTVASGVKFTPHTLRHTFAREMVDNDFNLYKLKEIMGHAQITTIQIYMSVSRKNIKDSLAKVKMF